MSIVQSVPGLEKWDSLPKAVNSHRGLQFQNWTSDAFSVQEELVMMPQIACFTQQREKAQSEVHVN